MRWLIFPLLLITTISALAQTAVPPPEINLDVTPLFDSTNGFLPTFISLFAIPFGFGTAIVLSQLVLRLIVAVLRGVGFGASIDDPGGLSTLIGDDEGFVFDDDEGTF